MNDPKTEKLTLKALNRLNAYTNQIPTSLKKIRLSLDRLSFSLNDLETALNKNRYALLSTTATQRNDRELSRLKLQRFLGVLFDGLATVLCCLQIRLKDLSILASENLSRTVFVQKGGEEPKSLWNKILAFITTAVVLLDALSFLRKGLSFLKDRKGKKTLSRRSSKRNRGPRKPFFEKVRRIRKAAGRAFKGTRGAVLKGGRKLGTGALRIGGKGIALGGRIVGKSLQRILPLLQSVIRWVGLFRTAVVSVLGAISLAFMTNPVAVLIAGIVGAISVAAFAIWYHWDKIKGAFSMAWEWIKNLPFVQTLGTIFSGLGIIFGSVKAKISSFFTGIGEFFKTFSITELFSTAWSGLSEWAGGVFGGIKEVVIGKLNGLATAAAEKFQTVKGAMSSAWSGLGEWAGGVFGSIKEVVIGKLNGLATAAAEKFQTVKGAMSSAWSGLGEWAGGVFGGIKEVVMGKLDGLATAAAEKFQAVKGAMSSAWGRIKGVFGGEQVESPGVAEAKTPEDIALPNPAILAMAKENAVQLKLEYQQLLDLSLLVGPKWQEAMLALQTAMAQFQPIVVTVFSAVDGYLASLNWSNHGQKLMETMATGVRAGGESLKGAIAGQLQSSRKLMPSSDAKEGPFSRLTHFGTKILGTMGEGVQKGGDTPISRPLGQAMGRALNKPKSVSPLLPQLAVKQEQGKQKSLSEAVRGQGGGAVAPAQQTFNITVNQAVGESSEDLLHKLERMLKERMSLSLSDGADYA